MYNNYPPGMRESDIPGWNDQDGVRDVCCKATDVEMKFVDPDEIDAVAIRTKKYINGNNPWHLVLAIKNMIGLLKLVNDAPTFLVDCDFEGDVEGIYSGNNFYWECPKCRTEHDTELTGDE